MGGPVGQGNVITCALSLLGRGWGVGCRVLCASRLLRRRFDGGCKRRQEQARRSQRPAVVSICFVLVGGTNGWQRLLWCELCIPIGIWALGFLLLVDRKVEEFI